jgi:hypothetical protein
MTGEYVPPDDKGMSQQILALSHKLEQHLGRFPDYEERKDELHHILDVNDHSVHDYHTRQYCAYLYRRTEDIPENPEFEQGVDARILRTATTCAYEDEEPFNIQQRQQELFGGWSWPDRDESNGGEPSTAAWPTTEDPKNESVTLVANPPPGSTWQSIAIEQRENAAAKWPISEGPKSEYVRMVVNPPPGSTWQRIANEQQRNATASNERTGSESPSKRQRLL